MTTRRKIGRLQLGFFCLAMNLAATVAYAQPSPPAIYTEEQASRGKAVFDSRCAMCHGAGLTGGPGGPPLTGPSYRGRWDGQSVSALFSYTREKMPPNGPVGDDNTYADLVAFMLKTNGAVSGAVPLSFDTKTHYPINVGAVLPLVANAPTSPRFTEDVSLPPDDYAKSVSDKRQKLLRSIRPVTDEMLKAPPKGSWLNWRRTYDAQGFGDLSQINRTNVTSLGTAWSWQMAPGTNEITPIVHDGVLFATSAGRLQALDAATGDQLWEYNRGGKVPPVRNLAIYGDLIYLAAGTSVVALDMRTGKVVWDQMLASADSGLRLNAGPIVAKGKVIQGVGGCINPYPGGCFIAALDAKTGREVWRFNTIARPGQPGGDTWNGAPVDERFGGSVWLSGSYDPDLDLLYFGIGQTYKTATLIHGKTIADRAAGLYTDSTVALKPDTGSLAWHYQHLPGDVWDLDWGYERTLATIRHDGKDRRIVTSAGKLGIFDALDARTGDYLYSIDVGLQNLVQAIDPKTGAKTLNPAAMPEVGVDKYICPSIFGARSWPATSYNARSGVMFVPLNETCMNWSWQPGGVFDVFPRPVASGKDGLVGRTQAIDLKTGRTLWTVRERAGHVSALLATAGGLVFEGTKDRWFRARDDRNGKILWQVRLDASPAAFPITYEAGGEQYVAVTTGGGNPLEQNIGFLTSEISSPTSGGGTTLWVFKLSGSASKH